MPPASTPHLALDPEFLHDYEQERLRWLRIRFLWFCGGFGVLWLSVSITLLLLLTLDPERVPEHLGGAVVVTAVLTSALFAVPYLIVLRSPHPPPRERILRMVDRLILGYALLQLLHARPLSLLLTELVQQTGAQATLGEGVPIFLQTLLIHLTASLLIPWTPREAIRPLLPFFGVSVIILIIALITGDSDIVIALLALVVMATVPLPGLLVCAVRHSRFTRRFTDRAVRARYGELRHELSTARRIHDRLFPAPITSGPIRLDYVYEPMRHIGGDFLFVGSDPAPTAEPHQPLSVLLIDVTGHGIAAALAVNRLHGELARIFGSEADASPGRILAELNRYIHLTMSRDTVFATAICLRIDPSRREVRWASAGHPPALLRAASGAMTRLESTTFLLGAAHPDEFDATEAARPLAPGDAILAYTDGAIEAKLRTGGMLGMEGLESLAAAAAPSTPNAQWCETVLNKVKSLRHGPAEDDTLLVRIALAPGAEPAAPTGSPRTPPPA